jgi:hypothetical protein
MKMFKFRSKAMADYYDGEIIVMAPTLKSAKAKVLLHAKKSNESYYSKEAWLTKIKEDLKSEPIESEVFFITGSS